MCIKGWSPVGTFHLGVFLFGYEKNTVFTCNLPFGFSIMC